MLNYRQLHYFWVVAKTGSIVRACEQLNLTPQTISGQISLFEQTYGLPLFQRVGRQLELTETGRQVLPYAEHIFQVGSELQSMLRMSPKEQQILFRVGVADVVPKSIVYRLIAPTMELDEPIRITCREDKLDRLLADLAIQRLDLVISDSPMPSHLDIKGLSQKLGECGISFLPLMRWRNTTQKTFRSACKALRCSYPARKQCCAAACCAGWPNCKFSHASSVSSMTAPSCRLSGSRALAFLLHPA